MATKSWFTRCEDFRLTAKIIAAAQQEAIAILLQPVYQGFGPTLAAEYLAKKHDIEASSLKKLPGNKRSSLYLPGRRWLKPISITAFRSNWTSAPRATTVENTDQPMP